MVCFSKKRGAQEYLLLEKIKRKEYLISLGSDVAIREVDSKIRGAQLKNDPSTSLIA